MSINEVSGRSTSDKNLDALRAVFPTGEIFAVSDDEEVGQAAAEYGLTVLALDDAAGIPNEANVILLLRHNLVSREIRKMFRTSRALVVPIVCFDPRADAAIYTLDMAMRTDYKAAADMGRYWADSISGNLGALVFRAEHTNGGAHTDLRCTLADDLRADAWLTPEIKTGQWISIGTYCELSLTAPSTKDWNGSFTIDGTAVASGALVARDSRYTHVGDKRIREALEVRDAMADTRAPIVIKFEGAVATSITAGGQDFTEAVNQVTNPEYELHPLELGIGTNLTLLPHVEWHYNSQLNEGAGAVHIGFGEGVTGAHMDFIVAESGHFFEPAAA